MITIEELHTAIKKHKRYVVDSFRVLENGSTETVLEVTFDWKVQLPSRFKFSGRTNTGIRSHEPVILTFELNPNDFALSVLLRKDFPRHEYPHINPSPPEDWVKPCLSEISNFELMLRYNIEGVLLQLSTWLDKAAKDELMDEEQGWEPYIFDEIGGSVVINKGLHEEVVTLSSDFQEIRNCPFTLSVISFSKPNEGYRNQYFHVSLKLRRDDKRDFSNCLVVSIPRSERTCQFQNFPVKDREQLYSFIKIFNKERSFPDSFLIDPSDSLDLQLRNTLKHVEVEKDTNFCLVFVLIPRPYNIIGSESNIEILPFLIRNPRSESNTEVFPLACTHQVDKNVLSSVSGNEQKSKKQIALIGAGSVGSKIVTALSKGGIYSTEIYDGDALFSHNLARHSVICSEYIGLPKALILEQQLQALDTNSKAHIEFVTPENFTPKASSLIIDCTGSDELMFRFAHSNFKRPIVQAYLYSSGKVGYLSKEPSTKSVRSDDIEAYFWTLLLSDEALRELMLNHPTVEKDIFTASCSSKSNIMSDVDMNYPVSAITCKIERWFEQEEDLEDVGSLSVCTIEKKSQSLSWIDKHILPTLSFPKGENFNWEIRVNGNLASNILVESKKRSPNEAGGCIIGSFCRLSKTVYVCETYIPSGIDYSPTEFELTTDWLRSVDTEVRSKTGGKLFVVGTWHSHVIDVGPSKVDLDTREELESNLGLETAVMLLVRKGKVEVISGK